MRSTVLTASPGVTFRSPTQSSLTVSPQSLSLSLGQRRSHARTHTSPSESLAPGNRTSTPSTARGVEFSRQSHTPRYPTYDPDIIRLCPGQYERDSCQTRRSTPSYSISKKTRIMNLINPSNTLNLSEYNDTGKPSCTHYYHEKDPRRPATKSTILGKSPRKILPRTSDGIPVRTFSSLPGPSAYELPSLFNSKQSRSTTFPRSKRQFNFVDINSFRAVDELDAVKNPAPTTYNVAPPPPRNNGAVTFSKSSRPTHLVGDNINLRKVRQLPGPGAYDTSFPGLFDRYLTEYAGPIAPRHHR